MNPDSFTDPSGQLHLVGRASPERDYWSFLPNPLPPAEQRDAIASVPRLLSDSDQMLGQLLGIGRALPNPDLLVRPYMRQEAVRSSEIEDTRSSLSELVAYEIEQEAPPESDVRDVHNYVVALDHGLRHVREQGLTSDLVRDVHRRLMSGARGERYSTPGEYRTAQNHIGGGRDPADGHFVPPPPGRLHDALEPFFFYLASDKPDSPVLVEAAWMHYQFEAIHPFVDGNGRVGRLLIPLLLAARERLDHPLLYLSPYFERNRTAYNDHLLRLSTTSSWAQWLRFFLEGVLEQADVAVTLSDRIIALGEDWRERLERVRASRNAERLADIVLQFMAVTARTAELHLGVTAPTAYSAIATLEKAGVLREATGRARGRLYAAPELISLFDRAE